MEDGGAGGWGGPQEQAWWLEGCCVDGRVSAGRCLQVWVRDWIGGWWGAYRTAGCMCNKLLAREKTRMIAGVSRRVARYMGVSMPVDVSGGGEHGPDAHTRCTVHQHVRIDPLVSLVLYALNLFFQFEWPGAASWMTKHVLSWRVSAYMGANMRVNTWRFIWWRENTKYIKSVFFFLFSFS